MRSGHRLRAALVAAALTTVVAGVPPVQADEVDDQRARVERIADDLDSLDNRLGELEEAHAAALDRLDVLAIEIQQQQASVDAQAAELSTLQRQLADIAVDKFTSGGASGLTPLFSSAEVFTDDLERNELTRVALDQGVGSTDEMLQLVVELTEDKADLDAAEAEQDQLVASLVEQQAQGEQLTVELQQKYRAAEAELGQLIVEEQDRRAAAAAAAAQAQFEAAAAAAQRANASNNAANGGSNAAAGAGVARGGGSTGAGTTSATPATPAAPAPAPSVPAPSSMSGVAIGAAQGQLGVPYKFAASTPGVAFDCSGLTKYAWGKAGVSLPHQSAAQFASTPHVPRDQAQPGDLIFYYSPIGHVGIYLGGGSMIHAPATGDVVKIVSVTWSKVVGVSRPG